MSSKGWRNPCTEGRPSCPQCGKERMHLYSQYSNQKDKGRVYRGYFCQKRSGGCGYVEVNEGQRTPEEIARKNAQIAEKQRAKEEARAIVQARREKGMTLDEAGKKIGISRERVRQLVNDGRIISEYDSSIRRHAITQEAIDAYITDPKKGKDRMRELSGKVAYMEGRPDCPNCGKEGLYINNSQHTYHCAKVVGGCGKTYQFDLTQKQRGRPKKDITSRPDCPNCNKKELYINKNKQTYYCAKVIGGCGKTYQFDLTQKQRGRPKKDIINTESYNSGQKLKSKTRISNRRGIQCLKTRSRPDCPNCSKKGLHINNKQQTYHCTKVSGGCGKTYQFDLTQKPRGRQKMPQIDNLIRGDEA
jgi:DNA-binding XRE family transcriptional regulator